MSDCSVCVQVASGSVIESQIFWLSQVVTIILWVVFLLGSLLMWNLTWIVSTSGQLCTLIAVHTTDNVDISVKHGQTDNIVYCLSLYNMVEVLLGFGSRTYLLRYYLFLLANHGLAEPVWASCNDLDVWLSFPRPPS